MLLSRCSSLSIQVTRFDWELNSPNLNIFISIQSLTQHCCKRICNHLQVFLLIFLILMPDHFLVFPLSLGQVLRESKVSVEVWIFRRCGEWRRTRTKSTREEKASIWGHFCQPFLNFYKFPVVEFSCDRQDLPLYLKMDFSSANAVHVLTRHSVTLPKNI